MTKFFVLLLSAIAFNVFASIATVHSSLPENDLWKEDNLFKNSNVTEQMFNQIITIATEIYNPIAAENNERLIINRNWSDSTVNANCSRWFGTVTVNMYGGLARRDETTPEGFALVLCHELGHAYGGLPYVSSWQKMSAEGQSDYYGAKVCHSQIMEKLKLDEYGPSTTFMERTCDDLYIDNPEKREYCFRGLIAGQSLGTLLATLKKEPIPNYETPDPTIVAKTETSYPKTVQCRLDTYFNGVLQKDRPACWFKN